MSQHTESGQREARRKVLAEILEELVGQELVGQKPTKEGLFFVEELVEVYRVNEDGRKSSSVGFFRDENIAKAFCQNQTDASWHRTNKIIALTNGEAVFQLKAEDAPFFDSDKVKLEIREKALAKLSPEERRLLGL